MWVINKKRTNSVACSPQVQQIPTAVNLSFPDWIRYFLEIAPRLSSRGQVDPIPDRLLLRKSDIKSNPGPLDL
jgi:hypothetical protein